MNYDIDYIFATTTFSTEDRKKLIQYYAKISEQERIEVEKLKFDIYYQIKSKHFNSDKKSEYSFCCLLLAISKLQSLDPDIRRKRDLSALTSEQRQLQFQRRLARIKELKTKRNSPKKGFVLDHYDELSEMLAAGFSYRDLAAEIARRWSKVGHINPTYLRTILVAEKERRAQVKEYIGGE